MFTCCESIKQFCFDFWCCMGDLKIKENTESPMYIEREIEYLQRSSNIEII